MHGCQKSFLYPKIYYFIWLFQNVFIAVFGRKLSSDAFVITLVLLCRLFPINCIICFDKRRSFGACFELGFYLLTRFETKAASLAAYFFKVISWLDSTVFNVRF